MTRSPQEPVSSRAESVGIDAAAEYLVRTVKCTLWDSLRKDGRARDDGFEPFPHNPRQEDYRDVVREIVRIAALSRPDAGCGVRVKPLEWHKSSLKPWRDDWHTITPLIYTIRCADENGWKWAFNGGFGYEQSPESAKAAAQVDYEQRILSALSTPSAAVESNASAEARPLRDRIARLINPKAFDTNYQMTGRMIEQRYAYERADTILATFNVTDHK